MNNELTLFLMKDEFWQRRHEAFNDNQQVVYIIKSNKPVPRVLELDKKGILYIGSAKKVSRLVQLLATVRDNSLTHKFGNRYKSNKEKFQEKYPLESLEVDLISTENAVDLEKQKLREYEEKFGELPPFNRSS